MSQEMLDNAGITFFFMLFHIMWKWYTVRQEAGAAKLPKPGFPAYLADNQADVAMAATGAAALFWFFNTMNWMDPGSAAAIGYGSSSIAKNIGASFVNKFQQGSK